MKKILLFLIILSFAFFGVDTFARGSCNYNPDSARAGDISNAIGSCLGDSKVLVQSGDLDLVSGFKEKIMDWIIKIDGILGLFAVGALVYAGFLFVMSAGEDEKLNKAKSLTKWSIIGFLGVIGASSLIAIVINIMYKV